MAAASGSRAHPVRGVLSSSPSQPHSSPRRRLTRAPLQRPRLNAPRNEFGNHQTQLRSMDRAGAPSSSEVVLNMIVNLKLTDNVYAFRCAGLPGTASAIVRLAYSQANARGLALEP